MHFLQPLTVGLVCAVLIALILMMGIMDLQRSERTLIGSMEDQGNRIIGVVERLTEENLKTMIIASQRTTGGASVPLTEQVLSPQKLLTEAIVAMGREIRVLSRKGEGTAFEILLPAERHNDKGAKSS